MRKIKYTAILGAIFGVILAMMPASAHVGSVPHVGNARWNNRADLTYQFVGNVGTGWTDGSKDNVRGAINGIDADLNWPPDMHVGACDSNPGKCINMVHKNCDGSSNACPRIEYNRHDGAFYVIYFYTDGQPVTGRVACRGVASDLGEHIHTSTGGCMTTDFDSWTGDLNGGEASALAAAYCDGCRGTDESDEEAPLDETLELPQP